MTAEMTVPPAEVQLGGGDEQKNLSNNSTDPRGFELMNTLTPTTGTCQPEPAEAYVDFGLPPTADEVAWATEYLQPISEVHVEFSPKPVLEWQDSFGEKWRTSGHVVVSPFERKRFKIVLRDGATEFDLHYLLDLIDRAREGQFLRFGWEEIQFEDSDEVGYRWSLSHVPPPSRRKPQRVVPCTEPACRATYHFEFDGIHVADEIKRDGYWLELQRSQWDEAWTVYVAFEGELDPQATAGMASDLQWFAAECRKLNRAAEQDCSRVPNGTPAESMVAA